MDFIMLVCCTARNVEGDKKREGESAIILHINMAENGRISLASFDWGSKRANKAGIS